MGGLFGRAAAPAADGAGRVRAAAERPATVTRMDPFTGQHLFHVFAFVAEFKNMYMVCGVKALHGGYRDSARLPQAKHLRGHSGKKIERKNREIEK